MRRRGSQKLTRVFPFRYVSLNDLEDTVAPEHIELEHS